MRTRGFRQNGCCTGLEDVPEMSNGGTDFGEVGVGHTVSPAPETAPCRSIWERLSGRPGGQGDGPECPASPPSGPQLRPGTPRPLQPRPAWILKPTQLGQEPLWGCLWSGSTEDPVPETGFLIHGRGNHLPPRPGPHLHSPWSSARSKFLGILGRNVKFIFCKNQAKSGKKIYVFSFSLAPSSNPN